jgi:hypothetical protein
LFLAFAFIPSFWLLSLVFLFLLSFISYVCLSLLTSFFHFLFLSLAFCIYLSFYFLLRFYLTFMSLDAHYCIFCSFLLFAWFLLLINSKYIYTLALVYGFHFSVLTYIFRFSLLALACILVCFRWFFFVGCKANSRWRSSFQCKLFLKLTRNQLSRNFLSILMKKIIINIYLVKYFFFLMSFFKAF